MQLRIIKVLVIFGTIVFAMCAQDQTVSAATPDKVNVVSENNAITDSLVSLDKINNDIKKATLVYLFPLSKFDISLKVEGDKTKYSGGETLKINGNLNYTSNIKEEVDKILFQYCKGSRTCTDDKCKSEVVKACDIQSYSLPFIEDVGVFAQIWRRDIKEGYAKGDSLIDDFYTAQNLSLVEGQKQDFSVSWKIPEELQPGSYYVSLSPIGSERFNLMGFPFNPSSKAISYSFDVDSANPGISIDKNSIQLNGQVYNYLSPVPFISGNTAEVDLKINNQNQKEEKVKVKYEISKWSQEDPKDILSTKEESLTIPGNTNKDFHISAPVASLCSTCNIKITASTEKGMSKSNVRFVVGDEGKGLFRFLGIVKTTEGKLAPVFCPRSAHIDKPTSESEIKITLFDKKDKSIESWTGKGKVSVNTTCYIISSINLDDLPYVKLKGELYSGSNQLDDQKEIVYDFSQKGQQQIGSLWDKLNNNISIILMTAFVIILLILIIILVVYKIKHKEKKINGNPPKI